MIQQFYNQNPYTEELGGKKLMEKIEHHFRKIKSMNNEEEMIKYCTEGRVHKSIISAHVPQQMSLHIIQLLGK